MKKVKEERLQLQNLKNIRIAFVVQTIGVIAILIYDAVTDGLRAAIQSPLWFVLIGTVIIVSFLNIKVANDVYTDAKKPKKPYPYYWSVMITVIVGMIIGALIWFSAGNMEAALIAGVVTFISLLIPYSYSYYLKKKQFEEKT